MEIVKFRKPINCNLKLNDGEEIEMHSREDLNNNHKVSGEQKYYCNMATTKHTIGYIKHKRRSNGKDEYEPITKEWIY